MEIREKTADRNLLLELSAGNWTITAPARPCEEMEHGH